MVAKGVRFACRPSLAIALSTVVVGTLGYLYYVRPILGAEATANYRLVYSLPDGWRELPHAPDVVFLFRHDGRQLQMRAAMSDVVDNINPTPDLDADALAWQYSQVTGDRLPGWHAEVLDTVDGQGVHFRLLKRWRNGRCVVSAFGVRGNSTLVIALSANGDAQPKIAAAMPDFRNYLASLAFERHVFQEPFAPTE